VNFSRFSPVRNDALNAPPVPINPARNPETDPPKTRFFLEDGIFTLGFRKVAAAKTIKKIPKINFIMSCGIMSIRFAPSNAKRTLGIPKIAKILQFSPCLKIVTFEMFPEICNIETRMIAVLKSTKNSATGSRTVDEPNPATVPIMTDPNDAKRKIMSYSMIF